jgi:hypothetical protein
MQLTLTGVGPFGAQQAFTTIISIACPQDFCNIEESGRWKNTHCQKIK